MFCMADLLPANCLKMVKLRPLCMRWLVSSLGIDSIIKYFAKFVKIKSTSSL